MRLKIFSIFLTLVVNAYGQQDSLVSEDLYLRINECIRDYHQPFVISSDEPQAIVLREKAFDGLNDKEKIRALAEWLFRRPPPHHRGLALYPAKLLIAPEPVILDYSELRRLMGVETDSRRFYQLSVLTFIAERSGHDFMEEIARGLFMEGIAADLGQSTTDHPLDSISMNTFSLITERLRDESQTFKNQVYPELVQLNFEERNLALANWLKANWPGCENLDIPEKQSEPTMHSQSSQEERKRKRPEEATETQEPASREKSFLWLWVLGALMLIAALCGFKFSK